MNSCNHLLVEELAATDGQELLAVPTVLELGPALVRLMLRVRAAAMAVVCSVL